MSLTLRKAARAASQLLEEFLLPIGLHSSQFGVLNNIAKVGSTTMTRLSEEMSLDRTTVTRNIQVMQREGLVEIVLGKDRRVREIRLTQHGKDVYKLAVPLWEEAEAALCNFIGGDKHQTLLKLAATLGSLSDK